MLIILIMTIKKVAQSCHLGNKPKFVQWHYKNKNHSKHFTFLIISRSPLSGFIDIDGMPQLTLKSDLYEKISIIYVNIWYCTELNIYIYHVFTRSKIIILEQTDKHLVNKLLVCIRPTYQKDLWLLTIVISLGRKIDQTQ